MAGRLKEKAEFLRRSGNFQEAAKLNEQIEFLSNASMTEVPKASTEKRQTYDLAPQEKVALSLLMQEMAKSGYVLSQIRNLAGKPSVEWVREPALVIRNDSAPTFVQTHREALDTKFGKDVKKTLYEPLFEMEIQRPGGQILSAKTLQEMEPGTYCYLRIAGEPFLRIGPAIQGGHKVLSGGETVEIGGELIIEKDAAGLNAVKRADNQTGTYKPAHIGSLRHTLEGLWEQGIYPKDFILDLKVGRLPVLKLPSSQ